MDSFHTGFISWDLKWSLVLAFGFAFVFIIILQFEIFLYFNEVCKMGSEKVEQL